jgi:RHS repeat-associated protein
LARDYDPWGNLLTGGAAASYAFTGREWDPEIALYYYRARYLDPTLGRFAAQDPAGMLDGSNRYRYVKANPINMVDPTGHVSGGRAKCLLTLVLIGAGAGAAGGAAGGCAAGGAAGALASGGLLTIPACGSGAAQGAVTGGVGGAIAGTLIAILVCPPDDECPKEDRESRRKRCYDAYYRDTAWCGETFTDDYQYERCMQRAWANLIRCLNGLPPKFN